MFDWKILAIFTPLFFVAYQTLSKLLPKGISSFLVNAYASLVGMVIMLTLHLLFSPNKSLSVDNKALPIVLGIGLLISLGNFGIIKAYSLGAPQSQFTPIFYVMLIIYGVLFGITIWKESLNLIQFFGIVLSIIGLSIAFYFKK
jgi:drug/metabolite transporter (DMT)-like permease